MGAPYSPDLRAPVIAAVNGGLGAYSAASLFHVSVSYIYKALGRRRATADVTAHACGRGPAPKLAPFDADLRERAAVEPDIMLAELQNWLLAEQGTKVSVGCLWKRLHQLGLTLKKSRNTPPSNDATTSQRRATNGALAKPI